MKLFYIGDNISRKLKNIKLDGKFLSPKEILKETELAFFDETNTGKLQEILMPSEHPENEEEFIEKDGIIIPYSLEKFKKWPQYCENKELKINTFISCIGKRKEFWATIRPINNKHIIYFEAIKDDIFPWTEINVIPEREIEKEFISEISNNIKNTITDNYIFYQNIIKDGDYIIYSTINIDNKSYTILDIGGISQTGNYILNMFDSILCSCFEMFISNAMKQLENRKIKDLKNIFPSKNIFD